jgi:threonine/homoserine/homoserine lactone efflux protein
MAGQPFISAVRAQLPPSIQEKKMQESQALFAIALAMLVGAMSPGPSFVMVARTTVSASRADGLGAALGMGVGGAIFAMLALVGLQGLLLAVPSLYLLLKLIGGAYLIYIGYCIWRSAQQPLEMRAVEGKSKASVAKSFVLGLTTQLSNPKTAIAYASVFAAFLPSNHSFSFNLGLVLIVFFIESGWYTVVALALSSAAPRSAYLRCKKWVDRLTGGVMMVLGVKLLVSARGT